MSYELIVKSGLLLRSQQVVSNTKIEQIGSKSKLKQKKEVTGISFCAAYIIQEDPA